MIRCIFPLFFLLSVCAQERFPLFSEDLSFYQGFEDSIDAMGAVLQQRGKART